MVKIQITNELSDSKATAYIWQQASWPAFTVNDAQIAPALSSARLEQGRLLGQLEAIGLAQMQEISRELWVQDALATAAIEGERLNVASARSSVARRLGLSDAMPRDRDVDGLVELLEDASRNYRAPLTHDRLCRWQAALFAGSTIDGLAGIRRVAVGRYRSHVDEMQIVSGPQGREVVHFKAPASNDVGREMDTFLIWFETPKISVAASPNQRPGMGGLVRAAIAHLWFETIHPV